MKRIVLGLVILSFTFMPAKSQNLDINSLFVAQNGVFTYHIPDDDEDENQTQKSNQQSAQNTQSNVNIVSDDITADTSGIPKYNPEEDYNIDDMYNYVLHGYAEYYDDEENSVVLNLPENEYLSLNEFSISINNEKICSSFILSKSPLINVKYIISLFSE